MEKQLQKNELSYQSLIESISDIIFIMGIDRVIQYISPSVERFTGYKPEQVIGTDAFSYIHPEDLRATFETLHNALENPLVPKSVEHRIRHQNGSWLDFESVGEVIYDDTGAVKVIISSRDLSERKRAEYILRQSQEKFSKVFRSSPNWITIKTLSECRYTDVNEAFLTVTGFTREEVIGKTVFEIGTWVDMDVLNNVLEVLKQQGRVINREVRLRMKSGEIRSMIWSAEVIDIFGEKDIIAVAQDITDRKHAEESLLKSEYAYRTLAENLPGIAYRVLLQGNNRMQFFNEAVVSMTGFTANELTSGEICSIDPLILPDDKAYIIDTVNQAVSENAPFQVEYRIRTKQGDIRYFSERGRPVYDAGGKPIHIDGVIFDITDRKKAQQAREELEIQLMQAQKIEAVGRLAGGVAHDFNNMLSVIIGHARIMLDKMSRLDPFYGGVEEILKAANRSADLTKQLLAFARKQTIVPRVSDINQIVGNSKDMLQRLIGENVHIKWIPGEDLWKVKIDPSQIDHMLINLAVNSRDAITGVGTITIKTANAVLNDDFCNAHAGSVPGEYVLISFNDTGTGMDKDILSKIFDPFFTTKEVGKGTGLGLATVYGILKQNNGYIDVQSETGKGTAFTIYIPRFEGEDVTAVEVSSQEAKQGTETILVVEDEPQLLSLCGMLLQQQGYTVITAKTPNEAIMLCDRYKGDIQLVITDVVMPTMNGRQLKEQIEALRPRVKALFMSGYTADVIAPQGVLPGGISFIQKPFSPQGLLAKVREVLNE